ncbi:MAG: FAD-dependent oxidoreductase [Lachnospiraceae bacterium]|nr:FAD-dependent oxidoreductase [Lachnospiraceae bacterium]
MSAYDKIIIGGGFYGLYSAYFCGKRGERVLLLEKDPEPFMRASYINQARVHMGYHYPRSLSTAVKSKGYFDRFVSEFGFCVNDGFEKIYAISANFSWTNAEQFIKFCRDSDIYYRQIHEEQYFKKGMCEGAFLTKEYAFDPLILRDYLMSEIGKHANVTALFNNKVSAIENDGEHYIITAGEKNYKSKFVLNSAYASINQIHKLAGFETFNIKYELCEIILCQVSNNLKNLGLTLMDGTFFSIMPFGKIGYHSLTSVSFTPHLTSYDDYPAFSCQKTADIDCSANFLANCNRCSAKPKSAFPHMSQLARKYLHDELMFAYKDSLFSVKAILKTSEIDDGRPTVIRQMSEEPRFFTVLSGKINTVFDLEDILV